MSVGEYRLKRRRSWRRGRANEISTRKRSMFFSSFIIRFVHSLSASLHRRPLRASSSSSTVKPVHYERQSSSLARFIIRISVGVCVAEAVATLSHGDSSHTHALHVKADRSQSTYPFQKTRRGVLLQERVKERRTHIRRVYLESHDWLPLTTAEAVRGRTFEKQGETRDACNGTRKQKKDGESIEPTNKQQRPFSLSLSLCPEREDCQTLLFTFFFSLSRSRLGFRSLTLLLTPHFFVSLSLSLCGEKRQKEARDPALSLTRALMFRSWHSASASSDKPSTTSAFHTR